jgi:adenylate kinase family enzyme
MTNDSTAGNEEPIDVPDWAFVPLMLVVGLPGSGKSTWCRAVAARTGAQLVDDFKSRAPDLVFGNSLKIPDIVEALAAGRRCIVADIDLTRADARRDAANWLARRFPQIEPLWVFFDNAPERCRLNVLADTSRNTEARLREIEARAPNYTVPLGARVLPVWARS